jgi:putative MFS transporter
MQPSVALDDLPTTWFHRRIAFVAAGGPFCDGFLLGIIAVALPSATVDLGLNSTWQGLVGASALIGMFVGGLVFGPLTDRLGRSDMYRLNLLVFLLCSVLQFFVTEGWQLFVLRMIMGIALGADYPIATALATEFLPRRMRGPALGALVLVLWVGYALSFVVGYLLDGLGTDAWRWMLVSAVVPSGLFLLLRFGTPESPRWLISVGRVEQAREIVCKHLGAQADFDALVAETRTATKRKGLGLASIKELFQRGYGPALLFCSVFWACQVAPSFAVKTFQPQLLTSLNVDNALAASMLITSFAIVGTAIGLSTINSVGRRNMLLGSTAVYTAALLMLGFNVWSISAVIIFLFIAFNIGEAAGSCLQFVYPNELFPTDLRGTGMGLATALSRIGSAAGTFVLPITTTAWGTSAALFLAAGIGFVGLAVSWRMAPETRHLGLAGASATKTDNESTYVQ